jgi:hypothetical protein
MINVTLKDFGQRPISGASILVDRTRLKQLFHTSQNRSSCCAFYWITTFSSANRVSGWPRGRNIGGVTEELRRLGLKILVACCMMVYIILREQTSWFRSTTCSCGNKHQGLLDIRDSCSCLFEHVGIQAGLKHRGAANGPFRRPKFEWFSGFLDEHPRLIVNRVFVKTSQK